jgi:hypothetical protein
MRAIRLLLSFIRNFFTFREEAQLECAYHLRVLSVELQTAFPEGVVCQQKAHRSLSILWAILGKLPCTFHLVPPEAST